MRSLSHLLTLTLLISIVTWPFVAGAGPSTSLQSRSVYRVLQTDTGFFNQQFDESQNVLYRPRPGELLRGKFDVSKDKSGQLTFDFKDVEGELWTVILDRINPQSIKAEKKIQSPGYLDVSDDWAVKVYSQPGRTERDCEMKNGLCLDEITSDTEIAITDAQFTKTWDPIAEEEVFENFYRIAYRKRDPRTGDKDRVRVGWVPAKIVSTTPTRDATSSSKSKGQEECDWGQEESNLPEGKRPLVPTACEHPYTDSLGEVKKFVGRISQGAENQVSLATIKKLVGKCLLSDPTKPPKIDDKTKAFDKFVMDHWDRNPPPPITLKNGQRVTQKQIEEIDALARTIYGEMAWHECSQGSHYMKAVAAIVKNREAYIKNERMPRRFDRNENIKDLSPLLRVVSAESQFSVWNWKGADAGANNSLRHVLCPPSDPNKPFWYKKQKPSANELRIWDTALRVARDAVLEPDKFKRQTMNISHLYYASGVRFTPLSGMREVYSKPSIDGVRLSNPACIRFFNEPGVFN